MNYLELVGFGVLLWLIHMGLAWLLLLPVLWIAKERVRWRRSDLIAFVLPFVVWWALSVSGSRVKSLANLGEAYYISVAIASTGALRAVGAGRLDGRVARVSILVALTAAAMGIYFWTPVLPE